MYNENLIIRLNFHRDDLMKIKNLNAYGNNEMYRSFSINIDNIFSTFTRYVPI